MENMEIKKILVTGSEGYIGSVLVNKLFRAGYKVVGLDTCYYSTAPKGLHYQFIRNDIRNLAEINLKSFDAIIHLAALSNDPLGEFDERLTQEINFKASIDLAKKAKSEGVKKFLFSSSCSIYGVARNGIVDETSPVNPLTAYAKSKIETEKELKKLADGTFYVGLLRNSTVYGYSSCFRNDLVVNNLVTSALSTHVIRVMSDGSPWRPLIDVRDLADIFNEFLKTDKANGEVINIGFNENNFQVKDIVNKIIKLLPGYPVIFTGEHGKDTRSYKVNFDKFKSIFPSVQQNWHLDKSIKNLILNLNKLKLNRYKGNNLHCNRLQELKKLLNEKKLNNQLYWEYSK